MKQGSTVKAQYRWLADGTKAGVKDNQYGSQGYEYLGSLVYRRTGSSSVILESTGFGGGRINRTSTGGYELNYQITDYLGSVRVVFKDKLNVLARNDFYAFGKRHATRYLPVGDDAKNRFLFNGKEKMITGNVGFLDYGARPYDPEIGRWFNMDPLAHMRTWESPFAFSANNPVNQIDPDGRFPVWAFIGGALDYGFQVYDNYKEGKSGYDAWIGDVNFVSVGLSAINPTGKFKVLKTVVVEVVKAATEDTTVNDGVKIETDVQEIATDAAINTVVSTAAGRVANAGSAEAVQNANKGVATANKQVRTATRRAERSPNSTRATQDVRNAQSNAQAARNKQVGTQILNSTVGQAPEATQQAATATTNRILQDDKEKRKQK